MAFGKNYVGPEITVEDEGADSNAAARLRQLEDLRRQGLITGEEYEKKRQEILRQL